MQKNVVKRPEMKGLVSPALLPKDQPAQDEVSRNLPTVSDTYWKLSKLP